MKKLIILLIAASGSLSSIAQSNVANYSQDKDLSRWVLDANFLGGGYTQNMNVANTVPDYLNGVNMNTGNIGFKNGTTLGGDAQIGFFFGKNRHWGLGTGIMYLREMGDVTLNNFHAEYQSVDNNGYTFRQVVSANNIDEHINTNNYNIPLVLKYKNRFSKHWGVAVDAGALFNLQMKNQYSTNASFNYEAIYKFVNNGEGGTTTVYDNSPTPSSSDFLITQAQYLKNNPDGNVQNYFNTKYTQGYNVGLGVTPNSKTGSVAYETGSVGFLFQPSINYFFSDHVALNVGAYYLYQPFSNSTSSSYMLTNKVGDYSSALNTASHIQTQSYGGNIGLRFFLGNRSDRLKITSTEQSAPTICGACDGSISLHGLTPNKPATISYTLNGDNTKSTYSGIVANDGTVKLPNLCAGVYTDINAKIGNKSANGNPVTLSDPLLKITYVKSTNPSAAAKCDASITIYGFNLGQNVTVVYSLNGVQQPSYTTVVASDNSITISGLCEGVYNGMTVTSNKCMVILTNPDKIVITAPAAPVPVAEIKPMIEWSGDVAPLLFDFNESTIHRSSYQEIDALANEMKEDSTITLKIEGNTDAVGTDDYNQKLSLRRAAALKTALVNRGIDPERIKMKGDGKREPVATNNTTEGRTENRNAEFHIILIDKK